MLESPTGFLLELELIAAGRSAEDRNLIASAHAYDRVKDRLFYADPHKRRALFAEALAIKHQFLRHPARQS
jgi:hypothetical protein